MNGTEDPLIPFKGGHVSFHGYGSIGRVQSMAGTANHWKRVNGIPKNQPPEVFEFPDVNQDDDSRVITRSWRGPNGNDVVVYEVHGGGHTVPQSWMPLPALLVGTTNEDINAVNEIWHFFFSSNH